MKKKVVIIGANEFQNPLILKAKELNYETHVFAWESGDVGEKTADYFYPISITNKEEILEVCKKIKPDAVTSIGSDLAVITVTYLVKHLNLVGNDFENSLICTNKYEMRKALNEKGIKVPTYEKVNSIKQVTDFKFPKIVKPTDRSGSRAITFVNNKSELEQAIKNAVENSFEKFAIVEDFITGNREYSCETISYNGEHKILSVTKKFTTGYPNFIEIGHIQPSDLNEKELLNLYEILPQALNALEIKNGASHTEFIVDENANINIVEIGARMGGDCIGSHLVELSTGYDFVKMVLDVSLGLEPEFNKKNSYKYSFIKFIFTEEDLRKIKTITDKYPDILKLTSEIKDMDHKVIDSSSRFGYYIFATNNDKILEDIINGVKLYEK